MGIKESLEDIERLLTVEHINGDKQNLIGTYLKAFRIGIIMERESCNISKAPEKLKDVTTSYATQELVSPSSEKEALCNLYNAHSRTECV